MNLKYPHLFQPLKLRGVTLKNRIFSAPISMQELTPENYSMQEQYSFYELRAKGGCAAVTLGDAIVHEETGRAHTKQIRIDDPGSVPSLAHMARSIKRHDCVANIEFGHGGKYCGIPNLENPNPDRTAYGPIDEVINGAQVHGMTEEMIEMLVGCYGTAAARSQFAGFEMCTVHAAHGWMLSQFMSPTNTRKDQFGGSLENRLRFPIMVCNAIREATGPGFPIDFRMNARELFEGGYDLDEAVKIAAIMQEHVDMLHVSIGNQEDPVSFVYTHPSMFLPSGLNQDLSAEIKKHVNVPVAVVGAITEPGQAEEILAEGKADVIVVARALIADPFWPEKARAGNDDDIVKCFRCFVCFDSFIFPRDPVCSLNPIIGEEERYFSPPAPPKKLKKVLVAGGGPGGLQAAITAAERGHDVILCEAAGELGGQTLCEKNVGFKKNYYDFGQVLTRRLKNFANVDIRLNTPVTPEMAEEISPDAIICAIGAKPIVPAIPGIDGENVIFCCDLGRDDLDVGENVVVIGAGLVGSESAVHFLHEGKKVILLEAMDDFAADSNPFHKMALGIEFAKGIDLKLGTKAVAINAEGVIAAGPDGEEVLYPADTVLCAVGMKADSCAIEALRGTNYDFRSIGDCVKPGKVQSAVHGGYYAAMDL